MARKVTPAQFRNMVRQAEQKQRNAINKYNREVKKVQNEINSYNRQVANYNNRVRTHNRRLQSEMNRLRRSRATPRYVTIQSSTYSLQGAFDDIDRSIDSESWTAEGLHLADLAEGETANSAAVANALMDADEASTDSDLRTTALSDELSRISGDLDDRWRGALYALDPANPDAARHFCTSAREVLIMMLDAGASDAEVLASNPNCQKVGSGQPTRREKISYILSKKGIEATSLSTFVDTDIDDVLSLFRVFNDGTHGTAGKYSIPQLGAIKERAEGAVKFIHRVTSH